MNLPLICLHWYGVSWQMKKKSVKNSAQPIRAFHTNWKGLFYIYILTVLMPVLVLALNWYKSIWIHLKLLTLPCNLLYFFKCNFSYTCLTKPEETEVSHCLTYHCLHLLRQQSILFHIKNMEGLGNKNKSIKVQSS